MRASSSFASQLSLFDPRADINPGTALTGIAAAPLGNFRLDDGQDRDLSKSWKDRAADNLRALRIAKEIEETGREPTDSDKKELIRFIGFGASSLANGMFRDGTGFRKGWETLGQTLEEQVAKSELDALARAVQYAHFTPEEIARTMWAAIERLGFRGGRVLEPGCGVGLLIATVPRRLYGPSNFTAVENDPSCARICRILYPEAWIKEEDFTESTDNQRYDLAIGNPPFSDRQIRNSTPVGRQKLALHDHFLVRATSLLRPGGLGAFVTSRYTMDKADDSVRKLLAATCDLVAAVRMPTGAMAATAGTDVIADILILRRREGLIRRGLDWQGIEEVVPADANEPALAVNRHFAKNPSAVLGSHARVSSQFGPTYGCKANPGADLKTEIDAELIRQVDEYLASRRSADAADANRAVAHQTPKPAIAPATRPLASIALSKIPTTATGTYGLKEGSFLIQGGLLMQVQNGMAVERPVRTRHAPNGMFAPRARIVRLLVPIRAAIREVLDLQKDDRPWDEAQARLHKAYDTFVRETKTPINHTLVQTRKDPKTGKETEFTRQPVIEAFSEDSDCWLVASIEKYDQQTNSATKGPIFSTRIVGGRKPQQIDCVADALPITLRDRGRVDMDHLAGLAGVQVDAAIETLGARVFLDPEDMQWTTADEYLSGKVRQKLAKAIAAEKIDRRFGANVEALQRIQPKDLAPSEIAAGLGSPWIPTAVVEAFATEVIGVDTTIAHEPLIGSWTVEQAPFKGHVPSRTTWGTMRAHAGDLLDDALNSRTPTIRDKVIQNGVETDVIDPAQTEAARAKLEEIRAEFEKWIWTDADRSLACVRIYNDLYNNIVPRVFDGSHLTLDDANLAIRFYPSQKRAIWRIVSAGSSYIAQTMGAGKTAILIASIMEQRRLGLIEKAMLVCPNNVLTQVSREFMLRYPLARILVADEASMAKKNRLRFLARATTEDWDCIVISQSAFGFIPVPTAFQVKMLEEQRDLYMEAILADADDKSIARKRLERIKEGIDQRIKDLRKKTDNMVTLCDIVNHLVVDEAHEYRRLSFATNRKNIKGISPHGSKRAWDLLVKARLMESINPGRGLVLSSGTPITNTIPELYSVMRVMIEDELRQRGVHTFDAWASTYGRMKAELELQPNGKYKRVERFCEFVNIPELINMFRHFADIVLEDELRQYLALPAVATGQRQIVACEPTDAFREAQVGIAERIAVIEQHKGPPRKGEDNILCVINDGRLLAIDPRMLDRTRPSEPETKLNVLIENAFAIWKETADIVYTDPETGEPHPRPGATQMIFSDLGVPSSENRRGFSAYNWIRSRLIELGVPAHEIAFMQDYKRSTARTALFNEMNVGSKRIAIGSTQTMGTGANAQVRLIALHHLDEPYIVSSVSQREGRIVRQGNQNPTVQIFAYVTAGSMDATLWQLLKRKAIFINAIMRGDTTVRRFVEEDSQAASFAYARALASGDPRLLQRAGLEGDIGRLERLKRAHIDGNYEIHSRIRALRHDLATSRDQLAGAEADLAIRTDTGGAAFRMTIGKTEHQKRRDAGEHLMSSIDAAVRQGVVGEWRVGTIGGFAVMCATAKEGRLKGDVSARVYVQRTAYKANLDLREGADPVGLVTRIENTLKAIDGEIAEIRKHVRIAQANLLDYESTIDSVFEFEDELARLVAKAATLDRDLAATGQLTTQSLLDRIEEEEDEPSDDPDAQFQAHTDPANDETAPDDDSMAA